MRRIFTMLLCSFLFRASYAQEKEARFSPQFDHVALPELFRFIEGTSTYFFYYDTTQVDSIFVDVHLNDQPIESVLEKVLKNTDLQYSIDRQKHVFISKRLRVITVLTPGFFESDHANATAFDTVGSLAAKKEPATRMSSAN